MTVPLNRRHFAGSDANPGAFQFSIDWLDYCSAASPFVRSLVLGYAG